MVCIGVAVALATAMYVERSRQTTMTDMQKQVIALQGMTKVLPPGAQMSFSCPDNNAELYAICRYTLAPMYLSFVQGEHFDTALTLLRVNAADSTVQVVTTGRRVLWQNTDDTYRYYLTCNP
ncbi:hypothetical protein GCM10023093_05540 [Nemorincola caseinilytica]|uniref:Uncharacterized protein n=1 Tax=Nemorincola caseinilytica TaxID=2054315 RepID=A0ABP8N8E2_9BACT